MALLCIGILGGTYHLSIHKKVQIESNKLNLLEQILPYYPNETNDATKAEFSPMVFLPESITYM